MVQLGRNRFQLSLNQRAAADALLYAAKEIGRDRTTAAPRQNQPAG